MKPQVLDVKTFTSRHDSDYHVLGVFVTGDNRESVLAWIKSVGCVVGEDAVVTVGQWMLCNPPLNHAWNSTTDDLGTNWVEQRNRRDQP